MKNIKSFFIYAWIFTQVFVIIYLWSIMLYTAVTGIELSKYIKWDWWIFLFMLDLWSAKFLKELADRKTDHNSKTSN